MIGHSAYYYQMLKSAANYNFFEFNLTQNELGF